ncbi:MAG: acyl carrier protein [Polyangiales bacterium]
MREERTMEELKAQLREIVAEVAEIDEVPDTTPFQELGIDSMMAIEIVADVERTFKLSIPEDELQDLTDLNAVFEKVRAKLEEADAAE